MGDPSVFDGTNFSPGQYPALHAGRSVRLSLPERHIGLVTATYSYSLNHEERVEVARRIAALWTLHVGEPTDELVARAARRPDPAHPGAAASDAGRAGT